MNWHPQFTSGMIPDGYNIVTTNKEIIMPAPPKREYTDPFANYLKIDSFEGIFDFLHQKYPCKVFYGDWQYPTAEHAFQAAKATMGINTELESSTTSNALFREQEIRNAESVSQAREYGKLIPLNQKLWDNSKILVLKTILRSKFLNDNLRFRLLLTGKANIVQYHYKDKFWCIPPDGIGLNMYGATLMDVREEIRWELNNTTNGYQDLIMSKHNAQTMLSVPKVGKNNDTTDYLYLKNLISGKI